MSAARSPPTRWTCASTRNARGSPARRCHSCVGELVAASTSPALRARSSLPARSRSRRVSATVRGSRRRSARRTRRRAPCRGFLVELRRIGVPTDRLVARASGSLAAGIVGSNASACSKLTCACASSSSRSSKISASSRWSAPRSRGFAAAAISRYSSDAASAHSPRTIAAVRSWYAISGSAGAQACASLRQRYASASRPSESRYSLARRRQSARSRRRRR